MLPDNEEKFSNPRREEWQKPIGIGFPDELKKLVEDLAKAEFQSFSAMVRRLVVEAIEARKKRK